MRKLVFSLFLLSTMIGVASAKDESGWWSKTVKGFFATTGAAAGYACSKNPMCQQYFVAGQIVLQMIPLPFESENVNIFQSTASIFNLAGQKASKTESNVCSHCQKAIETDTGKFFRAEAARGG